MAALTPCVDVCRLDAAAATCLGCRRTLDEIARWSGMTAAERSRIMQAIADRPLPAAVNREIVG